MPRPFLPDSIFARRSDRLRQEAGQRDAKRLRDLGDCIDAARAKASPGAAATRQAMEAAMKAQRP